MTLNTDFLSVARRKFHKLTSDREFSEILSGSAWALMARVAGAALVVVANIIIARVYGAQALGTLAVVNSLLILITVFTALGTNSSILRLIPEHIAKYSVTSAFHAYRKTQYRVVVVSVVTGFALFLRRARLRTRSSRSRSFPISLPWRQALSWSRP